MIYFNKSFSDVATLIELSEKHNFREAKCFQEFLAHIKCITARYSKGGNKCIQQCPFETTTSDSSSDNREVASVIIKDGDLSDAFQ